MISNQQANQICKIACLDFLDQTHAKTSSEDNLGLLLLGDQLGFLYIIQLSKHEGHQDQLLYMANLSQSSNQEAWSIIAAKFISCLDAKFARMTADGDLSVFEALIDQED